MLHHRLIGLGLAATLGIAGCSLFGTVNPANVRPSLNLYATLPNQNALSVVSVEQRRFDSLISVGQSPRNLAINTRQDLEFAYTANEGDNSVSFVNLRTGAVVQTVQVGAKPWGIALGPAVKKTTGGRTTYVQRLYTANPGDNTVSIIELSDTGVGTPFTKQMPSDFLGRPHGIVVSPSGQTAYVLSDTSATVGSAKGCYIAKIDENNSVTNSFQVQNSVSLWRGVITGTSMYLTDRGLPYLWKLDLNNLAAGGKQIPLQGQAESIVLEPGDTPTTAYVTVPQGSDPSLIKGCVSSINLSTDNREQSMAPGNTVGEAQTPMGLAISSTGTNLWVALANNRLGVMENVHGTKITGSGNTFSVVPYTSTPGESPPIGDIAMGPGVQ